ncbi:hypothetical protein [Mycoplasma buteonis]|uniref:hypothetical protein n=1 Tax=Mycoplasma buteonis TaxID=171280 RepID=UPI00056BF1AC|nr:hypothetical protein [Mycoplasma buteonis]
MLKKILFTFAMPVMIPLISASCQEVKNEKYISKEENEQNKFLKESEFSNLNSKFNKKALTYLLSSDLNKFMYQNQLNEFKNLIEKIRRINKKLNTQEQNIEILNEVFKINIYLDYLKILIIQKEIQNNLKSFNLLTSENAFDKNHPDYEKLKEDLNLKDKKVKDWINELLKIHINYKLENSSEPLIKSNDNFPVFHKLGKGTSYTEISSENNELEIDSNKLLLKIQKNDKKILDFAEFYQKHYGLSNNVAILSFAHKLEKLIGKTLDFSAMLTRKTNSAPIKNIKVTKILAPWNNTLDILVNSDSITWKNIAAKFLKKDFFQIEYNEFFGKEAPFYSKENINTDDINISDLTREIENIKSDDLISTVKKSDSLLKKYSKDLTFYKISIPIYEKSSDVKIQLHGKMDSFGKLLDQKIEISYKPKLYQDVTYLSFEDFKEKYDDFLNKYIKIIKTISSKENKDDAVIKKQIKEAAQSLVEIYEAQQNNYLVQYFEPIETKEFVIGIDNSIKQFNPVFSINSRVSDALLPFWISGYENADQFLENFEILNDLGLGSENKIYSVTEILKNLNKEKVDN